jgi:hypothetical protein
VVCTSQHVHFIAGDGVAKHEHQHLALEVSTSLNMQKHTAILGMLTLYVLAFSQYLAYTIQNGGLQFF